MSSKKSSTSDSPADFEQQLKRLEELVEQMESGELSLEDSLAAFEEGVALTRIAQTALQAAEQRVLALSEADGELLAQPFTARDEEP